jgi:branched-chain amino acid transport system permease protein
MMTTIFSGLSDGALYALVALVLTIPLVRCGDFNFAQPAYIVLAEYLLVDLTNKGWSLIPILLVLIALGAVLGGVQEVVLQRPTRGRDTSLVTMLGMFVAIQGFILANWGPNPESVNFFGGSNAIHILGGVLQPNDLWLIGVALVASIVLQLAVRHTRWGVLGRASMTDEVAAGLRGVNVPRLRTTAFILAGALSAALAVLIAPKTGVNSDNALTLVVFAFAAMAIGGIGSFAGAAVGGVIIGLVDAFASRYLTVDWAQILVFAILCLVLVVRPQGLFGRRQLRLV